MRVRTRALARLVAAASIAAATLGVPAAYADSTPSPTSTVVDISGAPSSPQRFGNPVLIEVALSPAAASGTVKLYDGAGLLGKGTGYARLWSYQTSKLAVGSHDLTATFTPSDPLYAPSTGALTYVITGDAVTATTTGLAVTPSDHINVGQTVTFNADVAPAGADGSVTFSSGSDTIGNAPVDGGVASMSSDVLSAGTHQVTATFTSNTAKYAGSASDPVSVDVQTVGGVISPTPTPTPTHSKTPKPTTSPTPKPTDTQALVATIPSGSGGVQGEHGGRHHGNGFNGPLPFTGLNTIAQLIVAAALLVAGALLTAVRRRRS